MVDYFERLFVSIEQTLFVSNGRYFNIAYEDDKFDIFDLQEVCELIKKKYPDDIDDFKITLNNLQSRYEVQFKMTPPFE